MPRTAKRTQSGDKALPPRPPVGVPYGEGERALESQRRSPLPNRRAALAAVPTGGGGAAGAATPDPTIAQAMEMLAPESQLSTPTARPTEPITQGLDGNAGRPTIQVNDAYYELKALVKRYPYPDLVRLLARVESEL